LRRSGYRLETNRSPPLRHASWASGVQAAVKIDRCGFCRFLTDERSRDSVIVAVKLDRPAVQIVFRARVSSSARLPRWCIGWRLHTHPATIPGPSLRTIDRPTNIQRGETASEENGIIPGEIQHARSKADAADMGATCTIASGPAFEPTWGSANPIRILLSFGMDHAFYSRPAPVTHVQVLHLHR
jgi:hypothetical protein